LRIGPLVPNNVIFLVHISANSVCVRLLRDN